MRLIKVDTGEYPITVRALRDRFKNVSFKKGFTSADLVDFGYAIVTEVPMPSCGASQKVVEAEPVEADGVWTQQWSVVDLEGEELIAAQDRLAAEQAAADLADAKAQALADNLPSWAQVETAVSNISSLADAKVYLGKLSRVVYLMAKNRVN